MKSSLTAISRQPGGKAVICLSGLVPVLLLAALSLPAPALAQYNDGMSTLRSPLIPGAPNSMPNQCPMEGQAPPIGDGFAPAPVNCGHMGLASPHPGSHVCGIPPVPAGEDGKAMVNSMVAPMLTPPPSHPAPDPGMIVSPRDFDPPPVTVTNINPGGGISGNAPQQRWGGQTTRDFGRGAQGSLVRDFGQKLQEKPDLKVKPQSCEDGPRASAAGGGRASSLPGAQTTQDRYGNRSHFSNQKARLTIAPY